MGKNALGALRMCLATSNTTATGRTNRNGREKVTAGAVPNSCELADDLVKARINVVSELNLGNRPQAVQAHADRCADNAAFGDRRINHPVFAVLALQSIRATEDAAEVAEICQGLASQVERILG